MKCHSCAAQVRWVLTMKGKRMPLDWEASTEGTMYATWVEEVNGWRAAVATEAHPAPVGTSRYTPHWVTCPDSDEWRKR